MRTAVQLVWLAGLILLGTACEEKRADSNSMQTQGTDAGTGRDSPPRPGETGRRAAAEDAGEVELEEEEALKYQFTRASFLACNDPDTALAMMRRIYDQARPGSALQREARWFIDQLAASDGGIGVDAGMNDDRGYRKDAGSEDSSGRSGIQR